MPSGDHAETAADPEAPDALRHGNVRTRRLAPLAGAGLLAFLLPLRIRASGASFAAAVVRVFACRALVLLFGLPARSRSVRSCGKWAQLPHHPRQQFRFGQAGTQISHSGAAFGGKTQDNAAAQASRNPYHRDNRRDHGGEPDASSTDTHDQRPRNQSRLPPLAEPQLAQPQLAQPQLAQPPSLRLLGLNRPVGMTHQPPPRYDPYDDRDRRRQQQGDADNLDDVVTHVRPTKS
jgi:hypothetical protein